MSNTVNIGPNWAGITPVSLVGNRRGTITLPSFSFVNTLYYALFAPTPLASVRIAQFNYSASKNFVLFNVPPKPAGLNFCLCIRYRIGATIYRYKIWGDVGELLFVPNYVSQIIKKNFVFEIWSLSTLASFAPTLDLINTVIFDTSVVAVPVIVSDISPYSLGDGAALNNDLNTSLVPAAPPVGGLIGWFKGDAGVTGSPVSAWADQSGLGNNLSQGTVGLRPAFSPGSNGTNLKPYLNFDGVDDVLNAASLPAIACAYLAVHFKTWTSGDIIFNQNGTTYLKQLGVSPQVQYLVGNYLGPQVGGTPVNPFLSNLDIISCVYTPAGGYMGIEIRNMLSLIDSGYTGIGTAPSVNSLALGSCAMYLAEILFYSALPTVAQELQIKQYLSGRYTYRGANISPITFDSNVAWLTN